VNLSYKCIATAVVSCCDSSREVSRRTIRNWFNSP